MKERRIYPNRRKSIAGHCASCGVYRETLHRDHIIPKFKGGSDDSENIQHLCANCHEDKSRAERVGCRVPDASRERMSVAAKKRMESQGARDRVGRQMTTLWRSPEYAAFMRESRSHVRRITPRGVQVIREMREAGHSQQYIADYLGLGRERVKDVLSGRVYRWVE